jgi:hypothetical protein
VADGPLGWPGGGAFWPLSRFYLSGDFLLLWVKKSPIPP